MNTPQRIVLIVGAIALLLVLCSTGSYQHGESGEILQPNFRSQYVNIWDWHTALVRSGIISVATIGLYLAVGKIK